MTDAVCHNEDCTEYGVVKPNPAGLEVPGTLCGRCGQEVDAVDEDEEAP